MRTNSATAPLTAALGVLALVTACGAMAEESMLSVLSGHTMGTTFLVKFVEPTQPFAPQARAEIESGLDRLLQKINRQMSTYLPDSELSLFNRHTRTNWFPVSPEVVEVVRLAQTISEESSGAFDITVGPLVNLWGFGPERRPWRVPNPEEIERLKTCLGYRHIMFRANPPALRKARPEIQCDLSAIAKGYGVDRVAEYLNTMGIEQYIVEIGGEVRANGRNAAGGWWRIGVQNPKSPDALAQTVALRNRSAATSGDYRQSFEQNGRRYSHTMDPRTGWPVTHNAASVTVIQPTCALADGWATALNVLGPEDGFALAVRKRMPVLMILRTRDGFAERMTPEFEEMISQRSAP